MDTEPQAMVTVYSCYFPQVQAVFQEVKDSFPDHILRNNIDPGLDDYHDKIFHTYENNLSIDQNIGGWRTFPYKYPCNGSSEAIFHLLAREKSRSEPRPIYILEGEYQGYQALGDSLSLKITTIKNSENISSLPQGLFIVSNPSAINGNILQQELWESIVGNHRVIIDGAYWGMTSRQLNLDLSNENIEACIASFSKPWGLYYFRIGLCWSKDPLVSLYGNKWFKNIFSLYLGQEVLQRINLAELRSWALPIQAEATEQLVIDNSDVFLLGYSDNGLEKFKRAENQYRFCLTPFFYRKIDD